MNSNLEDQIKQDLYQDFESLKEYIAYRKLDYELFKQNYDLWPEFRESLVSAVAQEEQPAEEQVDQIHEEPIVPPPVMTTSQSIPPGKKEPGIAPPIKQDEIGVIEDFDDFADSAPPVTAAKPQQKIPEAPVVIEDKPLPKVVEEDILDFKPSKPLGIVQNLVQEGVAFNSNSSAGVPKTINPSKSKVPQVVDNTKKPPQSNKPQVPTELAYQLQDRIAPVEAVPILQEEVDVPAPPIIVEDDHFFDDWHDAGAQKVTKPPSPDLSQKQKPPVIPAPPITQLPPPLPIVKDVTPANVMADPPILSPTFQAPPAVPLIIQHPNPQEAHIPTVLLHTATPPILPPTPPVKPGPQYLQPPMPQHEPELPPVLPVVKQPSPAFEELDEVLPLPASFANPPSHQDKHQDAVAPTEFIETDFFQSYAADQTYKRLIVGIQNKVLKMGNQTDIVQNWPPLHAEGGITKSIFNSNGKGLIVSSQFKLPAANLGQSTQRKLNVSSFLSKAHIPGDSTSVLRDPVKAKVSVVSQKFKIELDNLPNVETVFKSSAPTHLTMDSSKLGAINQIKSQFSNIATEEDKQQFRQSGIRKIKLDLQTPIPQTGDWSKKGKCIKIELDDPHANKPVPNTTTTAQPRLVLKKAADATPKATNDSVAAEFQQATRSLLSADPKTANSKTVGHSSILAPPEERYKWTGYQPSPSPADLFKVDVSKLSPSILNPFEAYFAHVLQAKWLDCDQTYRPKLDFIQNKYHRLLEDNKDQKLEKIRLVFEHFETLQTLPEQELLFVQVVDVFCEQTADRSFHSSKSDPVNQQRRSQLQLAVNHARDEVARCFD